MQIADKPSAPSRPGHYLAPSRCFGTKRAVQQPRQQAPNLPAIHLAMSNMAYIRGGSWAEIKKLN
ncbi:DUF1589 domain-containing protein [Rhodopirellula baltica]